MGMDVDEPWRHRQTRNIQALPRFPGDFGRNLGDHAILYGHIRLYRFLGKAVIYKTILQYQQMGHLFAS